MKVTGKRLVQENSKVWPFEYFGSRNRNARGKRYYRDGADIKTANRKVRHDRSYLKDVA